MTKKTLLASVLAAGVLVLGSCSEDAPMGTVGTGNLNPVVSLDASTLQPRQSRAESRAETPLASELSLRLSKVDGSFSREWANLSDFDVSTQFSVGNYIFEAWHGDADAVGFDCPYYYGSTSVKIEDSKTSSIALTATLAQAMVSVNYTDNFKNYMTAYGAKVNGISYTADETRPVYVAPGNVTLLIDFTKPNGVTGENFEAASFQALARTHYTITVDMDQEASDASIVITYDDELATQEVTIDISDAVLSAPAPEVTAIGFTPGTAINFISGLAIDAEPKMQIVARAGLASVTLTTSSASLINQGWPEEIDLLNANIEQQNILKNLGLNALGLWNNPDVMAVVDFSAVPTHMTGEPSLNTFSLIVRDRNNKTTEPIELAFNMEALVLGLSFDGVYTVGEPLLVNMTYNGNHPEENVSFEYKNERGTWTQITNVAITNISGTNYEVSLSGLPQDKDSFIIRAQCNGQYSQELTAKGVPFKVSLDETDVYSNYASVTVIGTEGQDQATLAAAAQYMLSTDNGQTWTAATKTDDGVYAKLTGLTPGTAYKVRVTIDGLNSRPVDFTTEAALQLPNSGFDTWTATQKGDYQYLWETSSWTTQNALTTSEPGSGSSNGLNCKGAAYKATSGTIPANSRTTKGQDSGGIIGTSKSGDGNTVGNATLHSDRQHSGANAALIRTVAWGQENGSSGSISGQHFGSVSTNRMTPGELNLEGYAFASRPSSISFWYHYDVVSSGNGDIAKAEVTIYDANNNAIASKSAEITEQSAWTQLTLALDYTIKAKAAKITVKFTSSINASAIAEDLTFWRCPGVKNISGGEYTGSELYIDDITLNY